MVFNVLKVIEVEPGAELGDTVYDQWVKVRYKDHTLSLFDSDMLVPSEAAGEYCEIQVSAMAVMLEANVKAPLTAQGNQFVGDVIKVSKDDALYEHIVDLDGLKILLSDHKEYPVGTRLWLKARLDVLDVRDSNKGWVKK